MFWQTFDNYMMPNCESKMSDRFNLGASISGIPVLSIELGYVLNPVQPCGLLSYNDEIVQTRV